MKAFPWLLVAILAALVAWGYVHVWLSELTFTRPCSVAVNVEQAGRPCCSPGFLASTPAVSPIVRTQCLGEVPCPFWGALLQ